MQLRDRGRLSLDDRITSYIPEAAAVVHDPFGSMDSVTLRMLLSHSAGFPESDLAVQAGQVVGAVRADHMESTGRDDAVPGGRLRTRTRATAIRIPAFIYLARVIEQLTGDPWETYVQKNIFNPLGSRQKLLWRNPVLSRRGALAQLHRAQGLAGREVVQDNGADFDPGITIPNGGWNAPLGDLAIYLAFLTDATHGDTAVRRRYDLVLPRRSLVEMWQPLYPTALDGTDTPSDSVGLSFFIVHRGRTRFIGHTGSQAGFLAFLYLNPATGAGVAAAFNTASDISEDAKSSAFRVIRDAALGLIE